MSLRVGAAYLDVLPRVSKTFGSDISKAIEAPSDAAGKKAGGLLGGALGKAAVAAGGMVAAKTAFNFMSGAADAAREANKVTATTEATIRATGGAAGITADQIGKLAESISRKTAVDDEMIQAGANQLLTFKSIRNELGKGNAVFDRATQAAVDLSAHGFGSIDSASVMLGKALEDPVKGVSALSRVGVTFTDQQKEQIATLVASGHALEAQKIILAGVEGQVAGTAAAQATASDRMNLAMGNLQETIGGLLAPAFERVAGVVATVADRLANLSPGMQKVAVIGAAVVGVVFTIVKATQAWTAVQAALNVVMALNPIGLVVVAIAALVAGLVVAYKKSDTFRSIVDGAFRAAGAAISFLWETAKWVFDKLAHLFLNFTPAGLIIKHFDAIKDAFASVIKFVLTAWNKLDLTITVPDLPGIPGRGQKFDLFPDVAIPKFHDGGVVPGRRGQQVPALLEAGELVTSTADLARLRAASRFDLSGVAGYDERGGEVINVEHLEVNGSRDPDYSATATTEALRGLAFKHTGRWGAVRVGRAA